jgi:NADH-quinone oxidoreductase subunit F
MDKLTVKVGLGSCGIAAGAQKVYHRLETFLHDHPDAFVLEKTNCIGMCYAEPLVHIEQKKHNLIYGRVTETKLEEIITSHLTGGKVVEDAVVYSEKSEAPENQYIQSQVKWALRNCGIINPELIEEYEARGGYQAILKVKDWSSEQIINDILKSGLRGRGGGDQSFTFKIA